MSDKFVASNGIEVVPDEQDLYIGDPALSPLTPAGVAALREFFQHERDEELGRWRSKLHPEWLGYGNGAEAAVLIHEQTGVVKDIRRGFEFPNDEPLTAIAEEYFADLPEPWHNAKPGECWAVTWPGASREEAGLIVPASGWPSAWECVITARRIWPEVSDAE